MTTTSRAWDDTRPPEPDLIDDCVHCGFCLPTCPTYSLWQEEMDSPRGRIVLMRAGHDEGAELSAPMVRHLDNCLGCMACVTACPSGVQYDKLIEDARAQVERNWDRPAHEDLLRKAIFFVFPHHNRLRFLIPGMWLGSKLRNLDFLGNRPRAKKLQGLIALAPRPKLSDSFALLDTFTPARGEKRGEVAFMQGCVQRVLFNGVNEATVNVLAAEGYDVHSPREHECCGALELHAGMASAPGRARATIEAYEKYDAVLVNAAGCGSAMKDYGHVLRDDPEWAERAENFAAKVRDVTEFLVGIDARAERHAIPGFEAKLAYHDACHLAHAQGVRAQPRELLRAIPGLEVVDPPGWEICCGSAGIYNITKPEPAAELGRRKVENLRTTGARVIAAANPGCAIQIAAHAEQDGGEPLRVLHPMEILNMSIQGGS